MLIRSANKIFLDKNVVLQSLAFSGYAIQQICGVFTVFGNGEGKFEFTECFMESRRFKGGTKSAEMDKKKDSP